MKSHTNSMWIIEATLGVILWFVCFPYILLTPATVVAVDAASTVVESGISFPTSVNVAGETLSLNGTGTRKATIFKVRVYAAALYSAAINRSSSTFLTSNGPHQLIMHFVRGVSADKLRSAWEDGLEKNNENAENFAASLTLLNNAMRDVKEGDRLVLTFYPGEKLEIQFVGGSPVVVSDKDFPNALLKVWLGVSPPNKDLKIGLLGK